MQPVDWQQRAEENERLRRGTQFELDSIKARLAQLSSDKEALLEINYRLMEERQAAADTIDALESELAATQAQMDVTTAQLQRIASQEALPPKAAALVKAYRRLPEPLRKGVHILTRPRGKGRK